MEISVSRKNDQLFVKPQGRLDSATGAEFAKVFDDNFTDDVNSLEIDFSEVDFISSNGLRVIISVYKKLNGRKMKITGANESVLEVFRLSGLLKVISINE